MSKNSFVLPLGLKNIKDVRQLESFKVEKDFPYSGLWVFCGAQGHGKTLLLMHILHEMVKEFPDALVVSNISIYGIPSLPYTGISDFEKYNNGSKGIIFVIDEIHSLFNSLESAKMPLETVQVWSQNRKNRRVILGTSQRFNRIAKELREQTMLLFQCYRPIFGFRSYSCFDATLFDDRGEYTGPPERKHFYFPSFGVMTSYNTLEVVVRNKGVLKPIPRADQISELEDYLLRLQEEKKLHG